MNTTQEMANPFAELELHQTKDYFGFFMFKDGLYNLRELSLSLIDSYYCGAGCDICYLKDKWQDRRDLVATNPDTLTYLQPKLDKILPMFNKIAGGDDINFLKKFYPNIFQYYVEQAPNMEMPSYTDQAINRASKIILNDLHFGSFYQFTMSFDYIDNERRREKTFANLRKIVKKYGKSHLAQFILVSPELNEKVSKYVEMLKEFAEEVYVQENIHNERTTVQLHDNEVNQNMQIMASYYSENVKDSNRIYNLLNEYIMLTGQRLYISLEDSTYRNEWCVNLNSMLDITAESIILETLKLKIRRYAAFAEDIKFKDNNPYYDYFKLISENIKVNDNFNFIPFMLISRNFEIVDILLAQGWTQIEHGYIRNSAAMENMVPLIEIRPE